MSYDLILRLAVFLLLFALFAAFEAMAPRRPRVQRRTRRWGTNLAMVVIDTMAVRGLAVFLPALAVGAALDAWAQGWGLFNQLAWPLWVEMLLTILLFDLLLWVQHFVTHHVPLFWRFHRVHHADRDMDVTTGLRFHPVEILASMGLKIGVVYLLGPQAVAVVLFEILLNGSSLFNHANLRLPMWLDRVVRLVLVTPDMHRVHHSVIRAEHDSNFGFALSIWDRVFGTYRAQPAGGHEAMQVGLEWQDDQPARLGWALWLPFRR